MCVCRVCAHGRTRGQTRWGETTAPKGGGLGKQQGKTTVGALGGVGEGRSYTSGEEIGVPKGVSGFFGARGKREIQVGAGRREPEPGEHPGLGGFPHTAGALDASLHLQETQWFPKAGPLAWKKGNLMELGTNSDSVGYFKGIPATCTILGNPLGQLHQNPGSSTRCRAWFGAPGDGSATSELWWLPVDPLFPPHPLQFQPQIPPAHRFRLRWVTSVTAQLCWGFREATEALALWSRAPVGPGHLLSHRILEICPAPLEAAGKTPWSKFSCCARSPAPWKELCSSSAASTPEEHPLPWLKLWHKREETHRSHKRGRGAASLWESSPAVGVEREELEGGRSRNPLGAEGSQKLSGSATSVGCRCGGGAETSPQILVRWAEMSLYLNYSFT